MTTKKFYQQIVQDIPLALCLVEPEKRIIQKVNSAFETLTGYKSEEICEQELSLDEIVYKRDLKRIVKRWEHMDDSQYVLDKLSILTKKNTGKRVELILQQSGEDGQGSLICLLRDIEHQEEEEGRLREQIKQEQGKLLETAKGIIRVKQLLEKLHKLPNLFRELWKCETTDELLQKIVSILHHKKGFHYATVTVMLPEGEFLHVKASNREHALQKFHLQKQHKFAQVFRGEKKIISEDSGELCLPIPSPVGTEGILQVILEEKERILISESKEIQKGHWDLLYSIAEFLGLMFYWLRASPQKEFAFQKSLQAVLQQAEEKLASQEGFYFLAVDIDGFTLQMAQEQGGEEIVQETMKILEQHKAPGSVLVQMGDDEFLIMTPNSLHKSPVSEAKQIQGRLKQNITCSLGIANYDGKEQITALELFTRALDCLKASQHKGGNTIYIWQGQQVQEVPKRVTRKLH